MDRGGQAPCALSGDWFVLGFRFLGRGFVFFIALNSLGAVTLIIVIAVAAGMGLLALLTQFSGHGSTSGWGFIQFVYWVAFSVRLYSETEEAQIPCRFLHWLWAQTRRGTGSPHAASLPPFGRYGLFVTVMVFGSQTRRTSRRSRTENMVRPES